MIENLPPLPPNIYADSAMGIAFQQYARAAIEADRVSRDVPATPDVDALANFIREIDGAHRFGAGALAERICEWLAASPQPQPVQDGQCETPRACEYEGCRGGCKVTQPVQAQPKCTCTLYKTGRVYQRSSDPCEVHDNQQKD